MTKFRKGDIVSLQAEVITHLEEAPQDPYRVWLEVDLARTKPIDWVYARADDLTLIRRRRKFVTGDTVFMVNMSNDSNVGQFVSYHDNEPDSAYVLFRIRGEKLVLVVDLDTLRTPDEYFSE